MASTSRSLREIRPAQSLVPGRARAPFARRSRRRCSGGAAPTGTSSPARSISSTGRGSCSRSVSTSCRCCVRSLAWRLTIDQALDPPHPRFDQVFSAFSIGLLANAVLPGRIGELARVAVLRRQLPHGPRDDRHARRHGLRAPALRSLSGAAARGLRLLDGEDPALGGHESDHRLGAREPASSRSPSRLRKRRHRRPESRRRPPAAATARRWPGRASRCFARRCRLQGRSSSKPLAGSCSCSPSTCRCARSTSTRRFRRQALVLLLMNVATIFPLWPGNFGLLQAAVALPLVRYGVAYSTGFAYAIVLQFVEMSVGVGVGMLFLAREGLSFAMLRHMPDASEDSRRGRGRGGAAPGGGPCARWRVRLASRASSPRRRLRQLWRRASRGRRRRRRSSRSPTEARERPRSLWLALGGDWRRRTCTTRSAGRGARVLAPAPGRHRRSSRPPPPCRSIRCGSTRSRLPAGGSGSSIAAVSSTGRRRSCSRSAAPRRWMQAPACSRSSTSCRCRPASRAT